MHTQLLLHVVHTYMHDLLHERYIAGDKLAPEIQRIHQGQSSLTLADLRGQMGYG